MAVAIAASLSACEKADRPTLAQPSVASATIGGVGELTPGSGLPGPDLPGGLWSDEALDAIDTEATLADDPNYKHHGWFVVECVYSHTAPDDPIVHYGKPGLSHSHDFFGNESTDAFSTEDTLLDATTTCRKHQDLASYWAPSLFVDGERVEPKSSDAYYRASPNIAPDAVAPFPDGLKIVAGSAHATEPQSLEVVGWACGRNPHRSIEPPSCAESTELTLRVSFPDCWNGNDLDSDDHASHMAYSTIAGCPAEHPVPVPQLEFVVQYPVWGPQSDIELAPGGVLTGHADFFNAWVPGSLQREVLGCIHRDVVCGVPAIF
ncbi:MAG: DUF1996 domain-containing protein [Acidimicrobiia bacterium]|nr:DUF1996 domain-containing protein [Acidimicrobiia bacterium]